MKLLLVRHGESRGNLEGKWQGWLDEPLTVQGREQAGRLAFRLQRWAETNSEAITAVHSSTLTRAAQTADILARHCGTPLVLDGRLRERNVGALQGLTWPELEEQHPDVVMIMRQRWAVLNVPGGETTLELSERVWQGMQFVIERTESMNATAAAVVSHGGALNAYLNRIVGRDPKEPFIFRLGNSSLSIVEIRDGRPRISLVNDICHLDGSA
jgi:probable phosphoglycerate mutase